MLASHTKIPQNKCGNAFTKWNGSNCSCEDGYILSEDMASYYETKVSQINYAGRSYPECNYHTNSECNADGKCFCLLRYVLNARN